MSQANKTNYPDITGAPSGLRNSHVRSLMVKADFCLPLVNLSGKAKVALFINIYRNHIFRAKLTL